MALTKEDLQAIEQLLDKKVGEKLEPIREQLDVHTRSITNMEQNVMRELKLLNENLPNALARSEKLEEVSATVEAHDHRIYSLEQKVSNG